MQGVLDQLPDDVDALKELVRGQAARNEQLSTQVIFLQEQLNIALAKRFASRSEQISADQIRLFDEAESTTSAADESDAEDSVTVSSHRRKHGGRKPLPERLPRIEIIHELPEDERRCEHDGRWLKEINEVVSEQMRFKPPRCWSRSTKWTPTHATPADARPAPGSTPATVGSGWSKRPLADRPSPR